ncbi:dTDP-4-dehydrorhamnose reductase [Dermacoccaceae bacterium W4C1]
MRWIVLGARGMLGQDLVPALEAAGEQVLGLGSGDCDVRSEAAVQAALTEADVIVNAAAWTAVDDAQEHEPEAFAVNGTGAFNVARRAQQLGARLVHISTDYVFDGMASSPYPTGTAQNPSSAYGRTKAAGEWAVRAASPESIVLRTAWLYGAGGPNFVSTMLRLSDTLPAWKVVDDQRGSPTWTRDLSDLILELVRRQVPGGYYHGTSAGETTWFGFARAAVELSGADPDRITPCSTQEFPRPAPRPAYSVLAAEDAWTNQPQWRDSLAAYLRSVSV